MSELKYKIELHEGCTSGGIDINGKREHDLSPAEHEQFVDYLLVTIKQGLKDNTVSLPQVIQCLQSVSFETDDINCDCCGDTYCKTTWEI